MIQQAKLQALIDRAIVNGFYSFADGIFGDPRFIIIGGINPKQDLMNGGFKIYVKDWPIESAVSIERIIFDHEFAKALWDEQTDTLMVQNNSLNVQQVIDMNGWRYHLQQAVIADNPIDYMYKAMFGK